MGTHNMMRSTIFRTAQRQIRQYSVATARAGEQGNAFLEARQATKDHAGGSADLWRKLSYYVALPLVVVGYVNVRNMEEEHERITYPYMNKRDKEYPWGMQSLFFNPHAN